MSFLGDLLGTNKAVDKGLSIIDRSIDGMFHTGEEKAEENAKLIEMKMGMVKSLQDEFTPRAVTRRIFAFVIFGLFFLHSNFWVYFAWKGDAEMASNMKELTSVDVQLAMLVAFFYYGYYGVQKILNK